MRVRIAAGLQLQCFTAHGLAVSRTAAPAAARCLTSSTPVLPRRDLAPRGTPPAKKRSEQSTTLPFLRSTHRENIAQAPAGSRLERLWQRFRSAFLSPIFSKSLLRCRNCESILAATDSFKFLHVVRGTEEETSATYDAGLILAGPAGCSKG
jgi:hypothetical protein